jgi:protein ImuB
LQRKWKARAAESSTPPTEKPPLVIAAKINNAMRITGLDRKATASNLSQGMALADARAMLPALKVVQYNPLGEQELLERIADWCDRYTPFVSLLSSRELLLDVTGTTHLFGGEQAMLDQVRTKIGEQGFAVRAALAGNTAAARALAHYRDGLVVPPGDDAQALYHLPTDAMNFDPEVTHAFHRAGLKTIGQIAKRKRTELQSRFGAGIVARIDHALGAREKPITPRIMPPHYSAEQRFAEPIVLEDTILEVLRQLAQSLGTMMAERDEGARCLEAVFFRTDGQVTRIAIEMGSPMRDAATVTRLFREKLSALADPLDPGFGFDLIRLGATRTERAEAKAVALDADEQAGKEVRFLIDRLAIRFGTQSILAFQPNETNIPEAAWVALPAQQIEKTQKAWRCLRHGRETPRRPLRFLEKPEAIDAIASFPHGVPKRFRWRGVWHQVTAAEGPERIAMEWWRQQAAQPTRDYFRIEDGEGRRFWLYREGVYGRETEQPQWFLQGAFA